MRHGTFAVDPQDATVEIDVVLGESRPDVYVDGELVELPFEISDRTVFSVALARGYEVTATLNDTVVLTRTFDVLSTAITLPDPEIVITIDDLSLGEYQTSAGSGTPGGPTTAAGVSFDSTGLENTEAENVQDAVSDLDAAIAAIRPTSFDVRTYGAIGDGETDDTAAIQAAIDACATAGGGVVVIPPGTYSLTARASLFDAGVWAALFIPSAVLIQGAGPQATILSLDDDGDHDCSVTLNAHANVAGADSGIILRDFSVTDAAGADHLHQGINFLRATDCYVDNVYIDGIQSSGPETFALEFALCANMHASNCIADGCVSGFSADGSLNVTWTDCIARACSVNGFTHNGCERLRHIGCQSYANLNDGYNSELSDGVSYVACLAGGKNELGAAAGSIADDQNLGNANNGFTINGTARVALDGCLADHNTGGGASLVNGTTGSISGGSYCANLYGIGLDDTSLSGVLLSLDIVIAVNTNAELALPDGNATRPLVLTADGAIGGTAPSPGDAVHWDGTQWVATAPPDRVSRAVPLEQRYVRLTVTEWTFNQMPALRELDGLNGGTMTATHVGAFGIQGGNVAANAIDGDLDTYYQSAQLSDEDGPYHLVIDRGADRGAGIATLVTTWYDGDYTPAAYQWEVSDDAVHWITVLEIAGKADRHTDALAGPAALSRMRIDPGTFPAQASETDTFIPWISSLVVGTDLEVDGDDPTAINVLTDGVYACTFSVDFSLSGVDSSLTATSVYVAVPAPTYGPFDAWNGTATQRTTQEPFTYFLSAGDTIKVEVAATVDDDSDFVVNAVGFIQRIA